MKKYCLCGCGEIANNKFIRGHSNKLRIGKTLIEIYGKKKAKKLKNNLRKKYKSKTYEQIHGKEKAKKIKEKQSKKIPHNKGKTWEETYGKEKAKQKHKEARFKIKKKKPFNKYDYEKRKRYRKKNYERLKKYGQNWRKENKIHSKIYKRKNRQENIQFRLRENIRARIGNAIRRYPNSKKEKTINLLGCSIKKLKEHLERKFKIDMTWNNYGDWHIDHIIPISHFDLTDSSQQIICFNYQNLQPLWAEENLKKKSL